MGNHAYIGTLHEDLACVAWRVDHLPVMPSIVVWVTDRGDVYAAEADSAPELAPNSLVGSYRPGRNVQLIEDDLRAALRERESGKS
jgi:hypothetical protein